MFRPGAAEAGPAAVAAAAAAPSFEDLVNQNALRIADLTSQLEQSRAELKRLHSRASRATGKGGRGARASRPRAPKSPSPRPRKGARSPRRAPLAPTQTPSPTSVVFGAAVDFDALSCDPAFKASPALAAEGGRKKSSGHWSAAEAARFEDAAQRCAPGAWEAIAAAVGTRSEKQVRAFAARQRRRGLKPAAIASQFAALDIPVPHNAPQFADAATPVTAPAALAPVALAPVALAPVGIEAELAAFAAPAHRTPFAAGGQHAQAAAPAGSLDLLSSSSSEALMAASDFEVCTPTLDYGEKAGAGIDVSSRGSTIEDMDAFAFEESFFQTGEKRAAGKQLEQQGGQQAAGGMFDWNCMPVGEGYDMPVDFTESFLMMEQI